MLQDSGSGVAKGRVVYFIHTEKVAGKVNRRVETWCCRPAGYCVFRHEVWTNVTQLRLDHSSKYISLYR